MSSSYPPPSQILQSPSLLINHFFYTNTNKSNYYNKPYQGNPVVLATLSFSTKRTPPLHSLSLAIKEGEKQSLDDDDDDDDNRSSSRFQVQNFMETIKAIPFKEINHICNIIEQDSRIWTISDFNDLLMALVIANEPDLTLKLYSTLSCYGLVPDSWTFSILIRCHCKKNEFGEAKHVLDHMVEIGFYPSVATCTILINSLCKSGKLKKSYEVFEVMDRIGCKPNVQTYNCLLKGLCYVGRVEEAYEILIDIKKSFMKPDIYTYTVVMDGFCKVGRTNEALELVYEAIEMGLSPSVVTFNTLFNGYCKEGRPQKGISVLKLMKKGNCVPDYISYSTLLHGLLKWEKIRAALKIYREMVEVGFEVEEKMMNTLLRRLCMKSWEEKDLIKDAYQVFEKMKNGFSVVDPNTYGFMIQALCVGNNIEEALVHLHQMIGMGYVFRTRTFNNIVQALCGEGKVDEALLILVLMSENSKIPSRTAYAVLINQLNRKGRLSDACHVYGSALKQGVIPHRKPQQ